VSGLMFPKTTRPRALVRKDRKNAEEAEYRRNAAIARRRDGDHCRICGSHVNLSTHHVRPRSLMRKSPGKHAVENLLTVCWGLKSCHQQIEDDILRVYPLTDEGTNGKVLVERWDDKEGGYVVAMHAA
jgi:hypothetical protein